MEEEMDRLYISSRMSWQELSHLRDALRSFLAFFKGLFLEYDETYENKTLSVCLYFAVASLSWKREIVGYKIKLYNQRGRGHRIVPIWRANVQTFSIVFPRNPELNISSDKFTDFANRLSSLPEWADWSAELRDHVKLNRLVYTDEDEVNARGAWTAPCA